MSERRIIQIIPASNWCAVYKDTDKDELKTPIACWALVEEKEGKGNTFTYVVGLDAADTVDFCDTMSNFLRYEPVINSRT